MNRYRLDNLPSLLNLSQGPQRDPLRLSLTAIHQARRQGGRLSVQPVAGVRPTETSVGPVRLTVELSQLDDGGDRLLLVPQGRLLGWRPVALDAGVGPAGQPGAGDRPTGELVDSVELGRDEAAELCLDPSAIHDYLRVGDGGGQGDAVVPRVGCTISSFDLGGQCNGPAKQIKLLFQLAAYRCSDAEVQLALDRLGEPGREGGDAPIPFPRLPRGQQCRFEKLLRLKVDAAPLGPPLGFVETRRFSVGVAAALTRAHDPQVPAKPDPGRARLAVGTAPELGRADCREPIESPQRVGCELSAAQPAAEFPVYLLLGHSPGAITEPVAGQPCELKLRATLREGQRVVTHCDRMLAFTASDKPPRVLLEFTVQGRQERKQPFAHELAPDLDPARAGWRESHRFAPIAVPLGDYAGGSMRVPLVTLSALVEGHLDPGQGLSFDAPDWCWRVDDTPVPKDQSPLTLVETDRPDRPGPGADSNRWQWRLRLDTGRARDALSVAGNALQGEVQLTAVARSATGQPLGSWRVLVPVRLSSSRNRFLAIDLGTSSTAMALAQGSHPPEAVNLGEVVARYDSGHEESGRSPQAFMASSVGLDPAHEWRSKVAASSLWPWFDQGFVIPGAELVARKLGRHYAVAVPYAPAERFGHERGAVLSAPKMLLMEHDARKALDTDLWRNPDADWSAEDGPGPKHSVDVERLVGDLFHELVDFHLPWATDIDTALGATLVLTHPSRYGAEQKKRLRRSARAACERLASDPLGVVLVPESDAALAYLSKRSRALARDADTQRLLGFDLGAGTLDVSLAEYGGSAGRGTDRLLHRVGAGVGGDTIDLVLFFIIDALLQRLDTASDWAAYQCPLVTACDQAPAEQRPNRLSAKRNLARALRRAKTRLSQDCRDATAGGRYRWPDGVFMDVQVGLSSGLDAAGWPVGLVPGRGADTRRLAAGAVLEQRGTDLVLRLSRDAVERPAMRELMRFMTRTLVEKALVDPDGRPCRELPSWLTVSGRAALWPLVYEGLAKTCADLLPDTRFTHPQPLEPGELKRAVVTGAIQIAQAGGGFDEDDRLEPRRALMVWTAEDNMHASRVQAWTYLDHDYRPISLRGGTAMSLMSAPPGLDIEELNRPWMLYLLLEVSNHNPQVIPQHSDGDAVRWNDQDGSVEFESGTDYQVRPGGRPIVHPGFYQMNYDVAVIHAPPGWPASVAPSDSTPSLPPDP